jgi:hypothetical protein
MFNEPKKEYGFYSYSYSDYILYLKVLLYFNICIGSILICSLLYFIGKIAAYLKSINTILVQKEIDNGYKIEEE